MEFHPEVISLDLAIILRAFVAFRQLRDQGSMNGDDVWEKQDFFAELNRHFKKRLFMGLFGQSIYNATFLGTPFSIVAVPPMWLLALGFQTA